MGWEQVAQMGIGPSIVRGITAGFGNYNAIQDMNRKNQLDDEERKQKLMAFQADRELATAKMQFQSGDTAGAQATFNSWQQKNHTLSGGTGQAPQWSAPTITTPGTPAKPATISNGANALGSIQPGGMTSTEMRMGMSGNFGSDAPTSRPEVAAVPDKQTPDYSGLGMALGAEPAITYKEIPAYGKLQAFKDGKPFGEPIMGGDKPLDPSVVAKNNSVTALNNAKPGQFDKSYALRLQQLAEKSATDAARIGLAQSKEGRIAGGGGGHGGTKDHPMTDNQIAVYDAHRYAAMVRAGENAGKAFDHGLSAFDDANDPAIAQMRAAAVQKAQQYYDAHAPRRQTQAAPAARPVAGSGQQPRRSSTLVDKKVDIGAKLLDQYGRKP